MVQQQRWLTEQCQEQWDSSSEEETLSDVEVRSKSFTPRAAEPEVVVSRPSLQSPCSTVSLSISSSPTINAPTFYGPTMVPSSQRSLREALRVIVHNAREALRVSS